MTTPLFRVIHREALISDTGHYRYWLSRKLGLAPRHPRLDQRPLAGRVVWIMLNPSTADALVDDATIRRCMGFAFRWGFEEVVVVNLFGYRSKDPKALYRVPDPVGPENDSWIDRMVAGAGRVVAAWGRHGTLRGRDGEVTRRLRSGGVRIAHLGATWDGYPRHPLYLPNDTALVEVGP